MRPVRLHARFACDLPVEIATPTSSRFSKLGDGRIVNLSMGGALVEAGLLLQKGVAYELRLMVDGEKLRITARVAREQPRDPKTKARRFGVSFTLSVKQEQLLKRLVDQVRMRQMPSGDEDRMRNYWSA